MLSSFDNLIKNVSKDEKVFLKSLAKTENDFEFMNKKGYSPFKWLDSIDKLNYPLQNLKRIISAAD